VAPLAMQDAMLRAAAERSGVECLSPPDAGA
jgi:hypothetical protein